MTTRAVLMDLDNTLYAYDPPDRAAIRRAFAELSPWLGVSDARLRDLYREAHAHFAAALPHQAGRHNRLHIFSRMIESHTGRVEPELALRTHEAYWRIFLGEMRRNRAAYRVLLHLSRRVKVALVTNQTSEVQFRKVARLGLGRYFTAIITSEQAGVEKPDPKIFRLALKTLGVPASQSVMLGDTIRGDIAGAQAAGIRAIQTVEYIHDRDPGIRPHAVIRKLSQILDHIGPVTSPLHPPRTSATRS